MVKTYSLSQSNNVILDAIPDMNRTLIYFSANINSLKHN
jgi:hypothetical protein